MATRAVSSIDLQSDTETLHDQTKIGGVNQDVQGSNPWIMVVATFIVLVVGLGAGTAW